MILSFDTETSGLPTNADLDDPGQPRIVGLGMALYDSTFAVRAQVGLLVKTDGHPIHEKAQAIHGISSEVADRYGVNLKYAMSLFGGMLSKCHVAVAHNIGFDARVIKIQFAKLGADCPLDREGLVETCTMKAATPIMKLKHKKRASTGYKWPTLQEAHQFFTGEEFKGAHDALADALACGRIYAAITQGATGEMFDADHQ